MSNSELSDAATAGERSVLSSLKSSNMTLQEIRFFSIYLYRIKPWERSAGAVRFSLDDFMRIMDFERLNSVRLSESVDSLMHKIVQIPDESGQGFRTFQLFKQCRISRDYDRYGDWYIETYAHDEALPFMSDLKKRYFKYELWNALFLKSVNQVRMYEILKQCEGTDRLEISVKELRELLGIGDREYLGRTGWSDFRKCVLNRCQRALEESTDICYTYERGKIGKGGKWLSLVFNIRENENYIDKLSLGDFIDLNPEQTPQSTE